MKIVLFDDYRPGLLDGDGVVDVSAVVPLGRSGQETLENMIADWVALRPALAAALAKGPTIPLSHVQLKAPAPKPGKIIGMAGNYKEGLDLPPRAPRGFVIGPEAITDPGGTVVLPRLAFPICEHEAELVLVIGKHGKDIARDEAMDYVFGYTTGCDISPRREDWKHIGKACDGFKPIGPCIVTADEIDDPHNLQIRLSVDGVLRQNYNTNDLGHDIPMCIEWVSALMTLSPGDLVFMGVNHNGLGPLQDGETVEMGIDQIGSFSFSISDPLKRMWPKEIDTVIEEHARNMIRKAATSTPVDQGVRPY